MLRRLLAIGLLILALPTTADALTEYYVDPDYGGGNGASNGAVTRPWTSLTAGAWTTINGTLASDDVTVWFSARAAGSDTDQTTSTQLEILRSDTSTHRLTLDGMGKWNNNDANPGAGTWATYCAPPAPPQPAGTVACPGSTSRFKISSTSAITTGNLNEGGTTHPRWYVTVRGFKAAGTDQGMVTGNIFHWIIEWNDISNTGSTVGATGLDLASSFNSAPSGTGAYPNDNGCGSGCIGSFGTDVIVRNNTVGPCNQECIYITGYYMMTDAATSSWIAFTDLTIENNLVDNPGRISSEGNCIDVKDGMVNLIVRGNTCKMTTPNGNNSVAIILESCGIVEGNFMTGYTSGIIYGGAYRSLLGRDNCQARNNVVVDNTAAGDYSPAGIGCTAVLDRTPPGNGCTDIAGAACGTAANAPTFRYTNAKYYNNSTWNQAPGLDITVEGGLATAGCTNVVWKNNVLAGTSGPQFAYDGSGSLSTHDHNWYWRAAGSPTVDNNGTTYTNATAQSSFEATACAGAACVDPKFVDTTAPHTAAEFQLQVTSAALSVGADLSGTFTTDFAGNTRVVPWNMGAWEPGEASPAGPVLKGLVVFSLLLMVAVLRRQAIGAHACIR